MDIFQASYGSFDQIRRQPFRFAGYKQPLRLFIGKRFYHRTIVNCHVTDVNRKFLSLYIPVPNRKPNRPQTRKCNACSLNMTIIHTEHFARAFSIIVLWITSELTLVQKAGAFCPGYSQRLQKNLAL